MPPPSPITTNKGVHVADTLLVPVSFAFLSEPSYAHVSCDPLHCSSWNATLPPPAQNSFLNGFFSIAEWGQYARTGVRLLARWAFSEHSPFATIFNNGEGSPVMLRYAPIALTLTSGPSMSSPLPSVVG